MLIRELDQTEARSSETSVEIHSAKLEKSKTRKEDKKGGPSPIRDSVAEVKKEATNSKEANRDMSSSPKTVVTSTAVDETRNVATSIKPAAGTKKYAYSSLQSSQSCLFNVPCFCVACRYSTMTLAQLKIECINRQVEMNGTKSELIEKLVAKERNQHPHSTSAQDFKSPGRKIP